jgi:hypothetical protein
VNSAESFTSIYPNACADRHVIRRNSRILAYFNPLNTSEKRDRLAYKLQFDVRLLDCRSTACNFTPTNTLRGSAFHTQQSGECQTCVGMSEQDSSHKQMQHCRARKMNAFKMVASTRSRVFFFTSLLFA